MKQIIILAVLICFGFSGCIHSKIAHTAPKHIYNDLENRRLLQNTNEGKLRIHLDLVYVIENKEVKTMISKVMEIGANFYSQLLTVQRMSKLFYPPNTDLLCNRLSIPSKYVDDRFNEGVQADVGIIVGTQFDGDQDYIASALACAQLQSNRRPIWGVINWNLAEISKLATNNITNIFVNIQLFQRLVFSGVHQIAHILAFSSSLYGDFYNTNQNEKFQVVSDGFDQFAVNTLIKNIVEKHYNCSNPEGLGFEDRYNEVNHWDKQHVGNQLMGANQQFYPYISQFTLTLFEAAGWYPRVNFSFAEPTIWGKGKGCSFIQKSCQFQQFCTPQQASEKQIDCNWQGYGMGICQTDTLTKNCNSHLTSPQFICSDKDYLTNKNQSIAITAYQQPGKYSKCFKGDLRIKGQSANKLNNRCYQALCLLDGKYIIIKIRGRNNVCYYPNYIIKSLQGMDGTITCPSNFDRICKSKKQCPYGCGSNGICVNGQCLCRDKSSPTPSCPPDNSRRLLLENEPIQKRIERVENSMKCFQGKIFDPITKNCQSCQQLLSCNQCNSQGCIICDDGSKPISGMCY